jgi:hypothetical protein
MSPDAHGSRLTCAFVTNRLVSGVLTQPLVPRQCQAGFIG